MAIKPGTVAALSPDEKELDKLIDPDLLAKVLPWFTDFIVQKERHVEMLRQVDVAGKFNKKAAGFTPSRSMRHVMEIPMDILWIIEQSGVIPDRDMLLDKTKRDRFLDRHHEYDMRIKR